MMSKRRSKSRIGWRGQRSPTRLALLRRGRLRAGGDFLRAELRDAFDQLHGERIVPLLTSYGARSSLNAATMSAVAGYSE